MKEGLGRVNQAVALPFFPKGPILAKSKDLSQNSALKAVPSSKIGFKSSLIRKREGYSLLHYPFERTGGL